eukprot:64024_1
MSTSNVRRKQSGRNVPIPHDLGKRSLPALPIHKRPLPSLNQSISQFSDTNFGCAARRSNNNVSSPRSYSLKRVFSYQNLQTGRKSITNWFNSRPALKNRAPSLIKAQTVDVTTVPLPVSKSKWRPSLQFIYDDDELLRTLTLFMRKQYNEENILFLQSVRALQYKIDCLPSTTQQIHFDIIHIYNQYIIQNAMQQVNLSYNCFNSIMSMQSKLEDLDLSAKRCLFDSCVTEIEKLVKLSILHGFYASDDFQSIACSRPVPPPIAIRGLRAASCHNNFYSPSPLSIATPEMDDIVRTSPAGWGEARVGVNGLHYVMSFNGLDDGRHEWSIEIVECDATYRYEVGIVSVLDTEIKISEYGMCDTPALGARVVYGYERENNAFYYASYNSDNTERCKKDLSLLNMHEEGWKAGDVIRVGLNIAKGKIKFYLNDKQVRKTISIEKSENCTYYPVVFMHGNGEYKI